MKRDERVYVFDADGVLMEPWGFARTLADRYDIHPAQTEAFFTGPFQACLRGAADVAIELRPCLADWGWTGSVEELIQLWLESENQPRVDVLEIVARLRSTGSRCCLASNQEQNRARFVADHMFPGQFDALYFSCDLGAVKPEAGFYSAITKDLQADPSQICFWDDSPGHVAGAGRCGWNAFLYETPESIRSVLESDGSRNELDPGPT